MIYPSGVNEESFLAAVDRISGILAAKLTYGSHDKDDVKQMVALYSLEAVQRYDPSKGNLAGYLFTHA